MVNYARLEQQTSLSRHSEKELDSRVFTNIKREGKGHPLRSQIIRQNRADQHPMGALTHQGGFCSLTGYLQCPKSRKHFPRMGIPFQTGYR
jgi:hypothetical protein